MVSVSLVRRNPSEHFCHHISRFHSQMDEISLRLQPTLHFLLLLKYNLYIERSLYNTCLAGFSHYCILQIGSMYK